MEGRSEHNLGLALDISTTDAGEISSGFADTTAGAWVVEHCHEYGFILRYPKDKTAITGYVFEPWHYRYVGIDLAGTLFASGQTLEEYCGKVPAVPAF
jgi:D-alanyl-D-alanine carboxypeptidase